MSAPLSSQLAQVDPAQAWQPWVPDKEQPWNAKWAAHLFRRTVFGASPEEVERAVKDGFSATFDRLIMPSPETARRDVFLADLGEEFALAQDVVKLRGWWLYAMLNSGHPFREKMTLFWHNHFATSIGKVQTALLMYRQNQLLRKHALAKFGPFLHEMSRDVAMLIWLDSNQNVKEHPNENYAREVLELFSLGVGNYTEKDVQEAARAFTGWHTDSTAKAFEFNAGAHDDGVKTVLNAKGKWNGDDVIRIALDHPSAARFITSKLYRELVSETEPPRPLLEPLAERFRKSAYDIADLATTMLRSRLFFSDHAHLKRIRSPIEFVLGTVKAAWPGPCAPSDVIANLSAMGQDLFAPPNVKGWPGGRNWLNNSTLLARNNFAEWVAVGIGGSYGPGGPGKNIAPPKTAIVSPKEGGPAPTDPQPEPPDKFDVAEFTRRRKGRTPREIVACLVEQFFPGGLGENAAMKLQAFVGEGNPQGRDFNVRIREAAHAMMCMPDYQLC